MADLYCKNCGRKRQDDEKFCPNCGHPYSNETSTNTKVDKASSIQKDPIIIKTPKKHRWLKAILKVFLAFVLLLVMERFLLPFTVYLTEEDLESVIIYQFIIGVVIFVLSIIVMFISIILRKSIRIKYIGTKTAIFGFLFILCALLYNQPFRPFYSGDRYEGEYIRTGGRFKR